MQLVGVNGRGGRCSKEFFEFTVIRSSHARDWSCAKASAHAKSNMGVQSRQRLSLSVVAHRRGHAPVVKLTDTRKT